MKWIMVFVSFIATREILKAMVLILKEQVDNRTVRINAISKYVVKSYLESSGKLNKQLKVLIVMSTCLFVFFLWSASLNLLLGINNNYFWSFGGMISMLILQPLVAWILKKNHDNRKNNN